MASEPKDLLKVKDFVYMDIEKLKLRVEWGAEIDKTDPPLLP